MNRREKNHTYMQNGNAIVLHVTKLDENGDCHMKRGAK
jgi:hypothetical protein